jgi:hypothetical protein
MMEEDAVEASIAPKKERDAVNARIVETSVVVDAPAVVGPPVVEVPVGVEELFEKMSTVAVRKPARRVPVPDISALSLNGTETAVEAEVESAPSITPRPPPGTEAESEVEAAEAEADADGDESEQQEDTGRTRRARGSVVSYKEPSLRK